MKKQDSDDYDYHIKADECLTAGDNLNAIKYYTKYLRANDNDYCLLNRGIAHYRLRHYKRALTDLQKVVSENTKFDSYLSLVFVYIASVLQELNQDTEALKYSNLACKKVPSSYKSFYDRATLLIKMEDYRNAIIDLDRAIKLVPTEPLFFETRGNLLINQLNQKVKGTRDLKISEELKY